jgi:glycosyltransferase involved in cell wall biosynthesis
MNAKVKSPEGTILEGVDVASTIASSSHVAARSHPTAAVVIATRNRCGPLTALLGALEAQDYPLSQFEVLIADDGSSDETWAGLCAAASTTKLRLLAFRLSEQHGQGVARNVALAAATAPVVAFTDDDCLPSNSWLRQMTTAFADDTPETLRHVVVQGRTTAPSETTARGPWDRSIWVLRPSWLFETCNVAYRRSDLLAVGGFSDSSKLPVEPSGKVIGEDAMLGWDVVEGGAHLVFLPEAQVTHRYEPQTYFGWLREQQRRSIFPSLISRHRLGRRALWLRLFLAPRTAATDAALGGFALGTLKRNPSYFLLALPWVWQACQEAKRRSSDRLALRSLQVLVGDLIGQSALLWDSAQRRCPVL